MIQVSARSYTLDEIDRLKRIIHNRHWKDFDDWDSEELERSIESDLRSAIIANVDVDKEEANAR